MDEQQKEVLLFGTWASCYCTRIALALKLKGISYDYVEEDLDHKSPMLLHYNPVYKKVPVLVHKGKSISESLIILEYIDEYWKQSPKILPSDPYSKSRAVFWAKFYDEKLIPASFRIAITRGEEQRKAIEEYSDLMTVFEEGLQKDVPFIPGQELGYLDIVVGSHACNYQAFHEVVNPIIVPEKHPAFYSWVNTQRLPSDEGDSPTAPETSRENERKVPK